MSKKNPIKRSELEAAVKPVIDVEATESHVSVSGNNTANTGDSSYQPTRTEGSGSAVKQAVVAKAISGNGSTGGADISPTLMNSNLRAIPYSGTDGTIIANAAGTPSFNTSDRRDSRYGQKTDNTARHINYTPSETYLVEYDGPKPLSESPDSVQGSLGHPANEFARIQKGAEGFPGAINFERSIDEITDDLVLSTTGQQVFEGGYDEKVDPSITFDENRERVEYSLHRGNYVPRALHVSYDERGQLVDFYYDEDQFNSVSTGQLTQERANTNLVTQANRAEVDRQAMAAKAGNEVESTWSPIPFAYPQPTADVMFMRTIEQQLGAQVYMATKMSAKAHSYQLNKATKDGMAAVRGAIELALGDAVKLSNSHDYLGDDPYTLGRDSDAHSVFNRKFTSIGAPSAIVAMYDSVAKYNNRGDFLTQPRSFNMILKQGLSNYKSFKMDPYFAKAFDNTNVFSTIDRPYDPSAPVCIQNGYGLMNAYSLNELGSCFRGASVYSCKESNVPVAALEDMYQIHLGGITNNSVIPVAFNHKLANSAAVNEYTFSAADLKAVRRAIFNQYGSLALQVGKAAGVVYSGENDAVIYVFGFNDINTDILEEGYTAVCNNAENNNTAKFDKITLTTNKVSVYNDYLAAWYKNRQNWFYIQLRDPYTDGIKTFLRENAGMMLKVTSNNALTWPIAYTTKTINAYSYLVMAATKYMQEQRAKAFLDVLNYTANFEYPFSNVADCSEYSALGGTQYGQSDIFELLEVRQMTPATALRWIYPEMYSNLGQGDKAYTMMPFYMTEDNFDVTSNSVSLSYDRTSMSYPVTRGGVRFSYADNIYGFTEKECRLILDAMVKPPIFGTGDAIANTGFAAYKYSQASDGIVCLKGHNLVTLGNHMCTPRELGYIFPVKGGYITPEAYQRKDGTFLPEWNEGHDVWGRFVDPYNLILSGHPSFAVHCWVNDSVEPAQDILEAGSSVIARAANFVQKCYIFTAYQNDAGELLSLRLDDRQTPIGYIPFTNGINGINGAATPDDAPMLRSNAASLWTRIQKLPFALNPFAFSGANVSEDPFTFNYVMGLVGFRASDYKEDDYNRLTKRMAEGWMYIEDPFLNDSLMMK